MFFFIQIDLLILKTYYGQFTLTTKKSLYIIFNEIVCCILVDKMYYYCKCNAVFSTDGHVLHNCATNCI